MSLLPRAPSPHALRATGLAVVLAMAPACDFGGSAPPPAAAPSAPASAARRLSPTAESVLIACDGTAPRNSEDLRMAPERMDRLAEQKSKEAIEVLHVCLDRAENSAELRAGAARRLADMGDRTALPSIRAMLRDHTVDTRLWHGTVLDAVRRLKAVETIPDLAETLTVTDEEAATLGLALVVESAITLLMQFDTPEAWALVDRTARDGRFTVRLPVVQALGRAFGLLPARERLLRFLDDPVTQVRNRACVNLLYEVETGVPRRPDLYKTTPCFPLEHEWPALAAAVRQAVATWPKYRKEHPVLPPPGGPAPPPGFPSP